MSDEMMQAIRVHEFGGPEVLVLEQAPRPEPQDGQVQIRLMDAGVNPADWKRRAGMYPKGANTPLPYIPGLEGAGEVTALGPGVTMFKVGQAVFGPLSGAYAEYAAAATADLQPKPANLSFEAAASVPVCALTAWGSLIGTARIQPGQRVLIQGAAGGVGMFAVQIAHWRGAQVYATTSAKNVEFVRSLGASGVIDYQAAPFETVLKDLDVVFDTVGGEVFQRSVKVLSKGGVLVTVAAMVTPEMGESEGVQVLRGGRAAIEAFGQIAGLLASGTIQTYVRKTFPLAEARQAHELSQMGHGAGKIILRISG